MKVEKHLNPIDPRLGATLWIIPFYVALVGGFIMFLLNIVIAVSLIIVSGLIQFSSKYWSRYVVSSAFNKYVLSRNITRYIGGEIEPLSTKEKFKLISDDYAIIFVLDGTIGMRFRDHEIVVERNEITFESLDGKEGSRLSSVKMTFPASSGMEELVFVPWMSSSKSLPDHKTFVNNTWFEEQLAEMFAE